MSDAQLRRTYALLWTARRPMLRRVLVALGRLALWLRVPGVSWVIQETVFAVFCGGRTLSEARATAERLGRLGVETILDYAAESLQAETAFDAATEALRESIEAAATWTGRAACAVKASTIQDAELLTRKQAGEALSEFDLARYRAGVARLSSLAQAAEAHGVTLLVDAEGSWNQHPVDAQVRDLMNAHNRTAPVVYMTIQAYLSGCETLFDAEFRAARQGGYHLGVKLVRGAYLDAERERARDRGVPDPTQPTKAATDAAYDRLAARCLAQSENVALCAATHNLSSVKAITAAVAPEPQVWFAQLLGMQDQLTVPLADAGYRTAKYVPYGSVREAFPYLVRRAEENGSVLAETDSQMALIATELARRGAV